MVAILRFIRHLLLGDYLAWRHVSASTIKHLESEISKSEARHACQICCVVEGGLHGVDLLRGMLPRDRALELFATQRVWDTQDNIGVLLYVCLADRDVEIVVDRGVQARVPQSVWENIGRQMEMHFGSGDMRRGLHRAIEQISRVLEQYFPPTGSPEDELPNRPLVL
ncbi:MAG: TPM domain-containing protein [Oligoflexia bacterium]|nr:TPM domain-containing protein [Oligoflexia bacterium]